MCVLCRSKSQSRYFEYIVSTYSIKYIPWTLVRFVAGATRIGRPQHSAPFMAVSASSLSCSSPNLMKPKLLEEPVMGLVTTLAPSTDEYLSRKVALSSVSVTSGDRSPTKTENSGACSMRLPPAPQFSR